MKREEYSSVKGEKTAREDVERKKKKKTKMEMVQFAWLGHISLFSSPILVEADDYRDKEYLESGMRERERERERFDIADARSSAFRGSENLNFESYCAIAPTHRCTRFNIARAIV